MNIVVLAFAMLIIPDGDVGLREGRYRGGARIRPDTATGGTRDESDPQLGARSACSLMRVRA